MPKTPGNPYPAEFRDQIVSLARAGRSVEALAREFEPCVATIHSWIKQADRADGHRTDGLTSAEHEELRRLRRENRQLRQERDIRGKGRGLVCSERRDVVSVYELMTANQAMFPISAMSTALGVSRSGFYAWRARAPSSRSIADAELTARIKAIYRASRETYGAPRIHAELIDEGVHVGRKRVERLMRAAGIVGVSRRKAARTTFRDERVRPACDLVERNFHADEPNRLWVADITYVPTWAGFLYLAVVLDAFSRRIVGWAMGHNLKTQLVLDSLNMALAQRKPTGVIHHSDQGSQYTSVAFGLRCKESRHTSIDGVGRRCLRQRDVRELLRDPGMRTARAAQVPDQGGSTHGHLRVHRGLVQSRAAALRPWLSFAHQLRKECPYHVKFC